MTANVFTITKTHVYENGTLKRTYAPGSIKLPQTTQGWIEKTVAVTTAEVDISTTELTNPGVLILHSLEATTTGNAVDYGPKTSTGGLLKFGELGAKDYHDLRMNSTTTLRAKAAAGTVNVQVIAFDL